MSKSSRAQQALPSTLPTLLTELGAGIAISRKRRRITLKQMAERMMVSLDTVQRLEKGDSGVGIGIVATALWVLGLQDRLQGLTDPARDHVAPRLAPPMSTSPLALIPFPLDGWIWCGKGGQRLHVFAMVVAICCGVMRLLLIPCNCRCHKIPNTIL